MKPDYVVDVHNLSKSFNGKPAVIDVSLQIKRGEIFGFLGPNGSGKTTTIRMICGLLTPDTGEGTCLGYDITSHAPEIKRLVGYVPQSFSLYQDLTVKENLEFIARVYGEKKYQAKTLKMMKELGLDQYKNILAGRLSGGWKQRLSLGAALIHDPKLLLLDEPTAGVDPKARREFWNDIVALTTKGITSLVSTHYMDEAERCNRLAYIVHGEMLAKGTIPGIIRDTNLTTYASYGAHLKKLADDLLQENSIEQVVILGNEIRVCGANKTAIQETLKKYADYEWHETSTNLEEVFVHLVGRRNGAVTDS